MDPYLRHGNYACGTGAIGPPPVATTVTTDVAAQVITAHVTPIIEDTTRHTKVTPPGVLRAHVTADACNFSQRPHHTPQTPTIMRHGPGTTGAQLADSHIHAPPPYEQHSRTPRWCKDGASTSIVLSTSPPDGLLDTVDSPALTTRFGHSGTRRQVRLPQTSDIVALHGNDPPGEKSIQRYGGTHSQRPDIRDLCQPHAHLSHGSANLSQGPLASTLAY